MIVLFQADIRRALAHFGRTAVRRATSRARSGADETIEEIVVAAGMLAVAAAWAASWRSSGASASGTTSREGSRWTPRVTYDLLVTIFRPGTPLHDGAVIIQGDRVAAAACFLPLTVNPRVSKDFGTRHRAAIGLTEETDAVTVIVSEETGRISLALDGAHRERPHGRHAARAAARTADGQAPRAARAGPRGVRVMAYHPFRHLGLKFLSVAVALGLWFVVAGEETVERSLRVPLELQNRPERLELVGNSPDHGGRARSRAVGDPEPAGAGRRLGHARPVGGQGGPPVLSDLTRSQVRVPFGVEVVRGDARRRSR